MSKFFENISWILLGNVAHAVLQFLLNIYVAREFGSSDYGVINYAASLISFFTSVGTFGFSGIITKKFVDDEESAGLFLGTGFTSRSIFAIASIFILQIIVRTMNPGESLLHTVVLCQSMSILFSSMDLLIYWYRYKNNARQVAIIRLIGFGVSAVIRIVAISVYHSLTLYAMGTALETFFFMFILYITFRKGYPSCKFKYNNRILKSMLSISYPFISSAILSTIYGQTDKIMLKSMVSNSAVGLYSVSLTLAGAIVIIPNALIEGFRPEIMISKQNDEDRYKKRMCQLYGIIFWICFIYCVFISMFAKQIILLLYGLEYIDAVPSLSLVVWYTSFSYFGAVNNLFMVAENLTKYVQLTTLFGAVLNICLNLALIPSLDIVGAALASLLTQIITNFLLLYFIKPLRKDFYMIIKGITLQWLRKN